MNLAQSGLNLDTDDLEQAGNLGLWKAVPKFDAARGMKSVSYTHLDVYKRQEIIS